MAAEDYIIDGKNISKIVKEQKIVSGWIIFNKIKDKYDIKKWNNKNNILYFTINNVEYKFGLPSKKISKVGNNNWNKNIMKFIEDNNDNNNLIVKPDIITFGKYKGITFKELLIKDNNYFNWLYNQTKDINLKYILESIIKEI